MTFSVSSILSWVPKLAGSVFGNRFIPGLFRTVMIWKELMKMSCWLPKGNIAEFGGFLSDITIIQILFIVSSTAAGWLMIYNTKRRQTTCLRELQININNLNR